MATRLGYPVVVKLHSFTITHKTDVGGVVLNVQSADEVKDAFETDKGQAMPRWAREGEMQGVTVQPMVEEGVEVIIGVTEDTYLGSRYYVRPRWHLCRASRGYDGKAAPYHRSGCQGND